MVDAHPGAELAPRDCVAREIWRQLQAGHTVYLDARSAIGQHFPVRFPTVFAHCQQQGLDPRQDLLPVVPAAHYHMGGIAVDICGRASLSNLWACGEVACTGVHGANRLASNSLLEALVFGQRVGEDIQRCLQPYHPHHQVARTLARQQRCRLSPEAENALRQQLRTLMWEHVGLVRTEAGLRTAQQTLQNLASHYQPQAGEVRNLLTVARLVTTAALWRRESRGAHFRADYPAMERRWQHHSLWSASDLESEAQRGATAAFSMPRARRPGGAPRYDQATVS
jgi:L-aspartate oxidase